MNAHAFTPTGSPKAEPVSRYAKVSPEARQLLAAFGAEAARFRAVERLPTATSVERVIAAIPVMRDLLDRLALALDVPDIADLERMR